MTLVLYDSMEQYAAEMVRYLAQRSDDIRTAVFFEMAQLSAWCARSKPDILLAAEELLDEELLALPAGRLVLLTEAEHAVETAADDVPRICRYQSADEILSEILLLVRPADCRVQTADGACAQFTVFYTPVPCPQQSALAWSYAADRQRERRVLYLSMQEYAGFAGRFGRTYRRDLSDLLYLSVHSTQVFEMLLRSVICEDEGLHYVPPPEQAADLFQVTEREWNTFLQLLHGESGFEEIVFDLGFLFPAAYTILEMSSMICLPMYQAGDEPDRLHHFLRIYEKRFGSGAMEKLREIRLTEGRQEA